MTKPELLSPAGTLKKLEYALEYGADAVYAGLKGYSLRASGLYTGEINEAVKLTRQAGKKIYVALNTFAGNEDIKLLPDLLKELDKIRPDAIIVADPGIFSLVKENTGLAIHVSTQANVTNTESAGFWKKAGAKRVTLARELDLKQIKEISRKTALETEIFIHGAMCLSYSGRCYISAYTEGRDANKGDCAQPCRWGYESRESRGERREVFELVQDDRGAYLMSSKDLKLIEYIPELVKAGVDSFKIEGRMKSAHYVAVVTKVYREAIDSYIRDADGYRFKSEWNEELDKISHRPYSAGFIKKGNGEQVEGRQSYMKDAEFVGEVTGQKNGCSLITVKNKLESGTILDVLTPRGDNLNWKIEEMVENGSGRALSEAHANFVITAKGKLPKYSLLRRSNARKTDA